MVDWEKYAWVKRSEQRQEIIDLLDKPRTPTDIADKIGAQLSQVSYSLSQFKEQDLVTVINEEDTQGRLYELTGEGRDIRKELESD